MAEKGHYRPWFPVRVRPDNSPPLNDLEIRKCDCVAIQAVASGSASAEQQKTAMAAIMHICGLNDSEYLPAEHGGERDSAFKSGKRHVALQLRKILSHSLSVLTGETNDRPVHDRRTGRPADDRNTVRARK